MRYGKLLGWGIAVYAVLSLVSSGLITYGFTGTLLARSLVLIVLVIVALIAGHALRLRSWKDILPYSLGWACLMIVLDAIFVVPLTGWELYQGWNAWFGYVLVAVVPLFASTTHSMPEAPRHF